MMNKQPAWQFTNVFLIGLSTGILLWHALTYNRVIPYSVAVESTRTCKTTTVCEEPVPCR